MGHSTVTLAFTPRETINQTLACLDNLLAKTPAGTFTLIGVAAGYPPNVTAQMQARIDAAGGELIIFGHFITPNTARNAVLDKTTSDYIVFLDHDVFVAENWLQPLVECAKETGAAIVSPLMFEGKPEFTRIHMAGGTAEVATDENGRRHYVDKHRFAHVNINTLPPIERQQIGMAEFHCALVETAWLKSAGGLDPQLLSVSEHWDMCVTAKKAGRTIFLEPESKVNYTPPTYMDEADTRWFVVRWSDEWNEKSVAYLVNKYDLDVNAKGIRSLRKFAPKHRKLRLMPLQKKYEKRLGRVLGKFVFRLIRPMYLNQYEKWEQPDLKSDMDKWRKSFQHTSS